jgi:hypothetical protein
MNSQSPVHSAIHNSVSLMYTVIVNEDYTWQCFIGSKPINREKLPPDYIFHIPSITTSANMQHLLRAFQQYKICAGNPDEKFVQMVLAKKGVIKSRKNPSVSSCFIDSRVSVYENQVYSSTVRTSDCDILIPLTSSSHRCSKCIKYRASLCSSYANYVQPKDDSSMTASSSHTNLRYICTP